jgi:hypothetical protein
MRAGKRISLPNGGNYSSHGAASASGVGVGTLQGRKCVRSESGRGCNRSLSKPPLLLVTREVEHSTTAAAKRKRVGKREGEREREREGGRGRGRGRNERNSACYHPTLAGPDNSGCTYRGSDVGGLQFLGPSRSYFVIRGAPKYSVGEFACYSDIALKRRKFITS